MVLTDARYFLRMESGEREGESIPIPPQGLSVGRRPDNALSIAESSVSGRHAELVVDAQGVLLRDLGSTNGTRVGAERVHERRLAHGDEVWFGSARATFVDRSIAGAAPAAPARSAAAGEEVRTLDRARVAAGGRKGLLGAVLVLLLLGAGAALALRLFARGGGGAAGGAVAPAVAVPGNLIADGVLEDDEDGGWTAADAAPASFFRDASFRATGASGLGCELAPDEWARAASPEAPVRARRGLALSLQLAADGGVEVCAGLELSSSAGAEPPFVAWADPVRAGDFREVRLEAPALPGYDRARVVLEARAGAEGGAARADDVVLLEREGVDAPAATHEDDHLHLIGAPPRTAVLVHAAEVVLSGLCVREAERAQGGPRFPAGTLAATGTPNGATLAIEGAPADAALAFAWHLGDQPFVATIGPDGFRAYSAGFEGARATALLLGRGGRLIRLGFPHEVVVQGAIAGGALRVEAALAGARAIELQQSFREERQRAAALASEARAAEKEGAAGRALAAWGKLLDGFPFETALVSEAETARARLLQQGHAELERLSAEVERARFFGLGDLYRRSAEDARALAARFDPSEVAGEARALAERVEGEAEALEGGGDARRARLEAVLGVLERERWTSLAEHVREALEKDG